MADRDTEFALYADYQLAAIRATLTDVFGASVRKADFVLTMAAMRFVANTIMSARDPESLRREIANLLDDECSRAGHA